MDNAPTKKISRRLLYIFLGFPFYVWYSLANQTGGKAAPAFASTSWVALGIGGALCLFAYATLYQDIRIWKEGLEKSVVDTKPRPVQVEIKGPIEAPVTRAVEPPIEVPNTVPTTNSVPTTRLTPSMMTLDISGSGNSDTYLKATDPRFPWPVTWDERLTPIIREQYPAPSVPLLVGVTRWNAAGDELPPGIVAPVSHLIVPGMDFAFLGVGTSGTGKSELAQTMLISGCALADPDHFQFIIIDINEGGVGGSNYQTIADLPHCIGKGFTASQARVQIHMVDEEFRRRLGLFQTATQHAGYQIDDISKYNRWAAENHEPILPAIAVAIDEIRTFGTVMDTGERGQPNAGLAIIERLAFQMRKAGIGPFLFTQYPVKDVLPRIAKTQVTSVLSFKLEDTWQETVVFGPSAQRYRASELPGIEPQTRMYSGRAIFRIRGKDLVFMVQTVYIPSPLKEQIVADICGRTTPKNEDVLKKLLDIQTREFGI